MKLLLTLLLLMTQVRAAYTPGDLTLTTHDRIVIEGDSITDAKKWSRYMMAYFYTRYHALDLRVYHYGRGGTTYAGHTTGASVNTAYDEYDKRVYSLAPDFVFSMFGHNEGSDVGAYATNMTTFIEKHPIGRNGALPILVGPHPERSADGKPVLGSFDNQLPVVSAAHGDLPFVKTWHILEPYWTDAGNSAAIGGADAVHPGTGGHIAIAYAVITGLGFSTDISSATLNAASATLTTQADCTVTSISPNAFGGIDFDRLDARIPFPMDDSGWDDGVSIIPEIATFQTYMLTVQSATAGVYDIYCDDVLLGEATHTELAAGVNLSTYRQGPVHDQGLAVMAAIDVLQGAPNPPRSGLNDYVSRVATFYPTYNQDNGNLSSLPGNVNIAGLDTLADGVSTAATPVSHEWSLRLQGGGAAGPVATSATVTGAVHINSAP